MSLAKTSTKYNSKSETDNTSEMEFCFVIMPFGGFFDTYYHEIFCPAIKNSGLEHKRADDIYRPSNIVQDIWAHTKKAKLILADLTTKNPNVFYELGLAHALSKPAILITQDINDIPFDLRSLRILEYNKNLQNWGDILRENIEIAIRETIKHPKETIPSAFLEVKETHSPTISKESMEILELRRDINLLKRELRSGMINLSDIGDSDSFPDTKSRRSIINTIENLRQAGFKREEIYEQLRHMYSIKPTHLIDIIENTFHN